MDPFYTVVVGVFAKVAQGIRNDSEAAGQLTLGALIRKLEELPQDAPCELCEPHSYRGFYDQLAFHGGGAGTVADALAAARGAMGQMYEGYKGGEFWMTGNTMTWFASWGDCGDRIVDVTLRDGRASVVTSHYEG